MYLGVTGGPPRNRGPASVKVCSPTKQRNYSVRSTGFGKSPGGKICQRGTAGRFADQRTCHWGSGQVPTTFPTKHSSREENVARRESLFKRDIRLRNRASGVWLNRLLESVTPSFCELAQNSKPNLFNIRAFLRVYSVPYRKLSATPFISIKTQKRTLLFVGELHRYPHKTADLTSFS